jgi:hypothetical protein
MTPNEYQALAMRTASGISTSCPENLLLQGVMGMSGESGEALGIVKKNHVSGARAERSHERASDP